MIKTTKKWYYYCDESMMMLSAYLVECKQAKVETSTWLFNLATSKMEVEGVLFLVEITVNDAILFAWKK